jgi:UDP-N-acetylmuramoyl-L-alanyl-D-glutamate--2,6-diaminopimelate ligase
MTAAALVVATGGDLVQTLANVGRLQPVRGRLERAVITRAGAPLYVDYAHTEDALESAIQALRPHARGRLITVFGAGGDRDQGKRPEMGRVAARLSDLVIVTDDNPRSEDPAASAATSSPAPPMRGKCRAGARRLRKRLRRRGRTISSCWRARGMSRARSSAIRCCRSTTSKSRGSARRELVDRSGDS